MLVDLVFGDKEQQGLLALRLDSFLEALGRAGLTAVKGRIASLVTHRVEALVRDAFRDLGGWKTSLRAMANQLEQLEVRAKNAVAADVDIEARELRLPPKRAGSDDR